MPSRIPSDARTSADRGPLAAVCGETSALIRDRWGRGPKRSRAYWADSDTLLVVLDDAHTDAELTLLAGGYSESVLAGRRRLSEILEPDLCRIAGSATQRHVAAVLSESHLAPDVTMLLFLLAGGLGDGDPPPAGDERFGRAIERALEETAAAKAVLAQSKQASRVSAERRAAAAATRQAGARRRGTGRDGR